MAQVIWTEPALQDLDRIADYISLDNPEAARKLVKKTFEQVGLLHEHPKLGKSVQELEESVYREILVSPCRIFYRIEDEIVYIIHVMRVEQLLRSEMFKPR